MKLKNIGTTVISVGNVVILPNEVKEVKGKAYENNAAIKHLCKTNSLEIVKEEEKPNGRNAKKNAAPKQEPKQNETPSNEGSEAANEGDAEGSANEQE